MAQSHVGTEPFFYWKEKFVKRCTSYLAEVWAFFFLFEPSGNDKARVVAYLCREALGKPIIPDKYTHAMRRRNHYLRDYLFRNFLGFTTIRKQLTLFFSKNGSVMKQTARLDACSQYLSHYKVRVFNCGHMYYFISPIQRHVFQSRESVFYHIIYTRGRKFVVNIIIIFYTTSFLMRILTMLGRDL